MFHEYVLSALFAWVYLRGRIVVVLLFTTLLLFVVRPFYTQHARNDVRVKTIYGGKRLRNEWREKVRGLRAKFA